MSLISIIKFLKKKDKITYLLIFIIAIAAFLRFYNSPYTYGLGEESVRDAVIGIEAARQLQLPLTGAFSSLGPFTFGPWYAYQLAAATIILPFNYTPWIYLGLISVLYVFVMYKIGDILLDKKFGLILAFLAAISPAQIISGMHLTSHNTTNIFAALAIWIFLLLIKKKLSYWYGFFLGLTIGIGMNLHFQMSGLLIFPLILLFYKPKQYLYFVTATVGVLVSFLPMFFFEVNNHWFNTRNIIYFMQYGKNALYIPNRWLTYVGEFWPSFFSDALGVPVWFSWSLIILFIIAFVAYLKNKKIPLPFFLLIAAFLVNFVLLRYYFGPKFFGYLNFLRPFVFLFTAFGIYSVSQKRFLFVPAILILAAIVIFSFPRTKSTISRDIFSAQMYAKIASLQKQYPNDSFTIYRCVNKYRADYNGKVYSIVFLLDLKNKLSDSGRKIAVESPDCEYPVIDPSKARNLKSADFQTINGMVDFSVASNEGLLDKKWKRSTFRSIYNEYARWWFIIQP